MKAKIANKLWLRSQKSNADFFQENMEQSEEIQLLKLKHYLSENNQTTYGIKYGFSRLKSYEDYAQSVPIIDDYEQIKGFIEQTMQGEKDVLFKGKPLFLESTSGSTSAVKYIPYNKELKQELQAAISFWMWDLYSMDANIFSGKAYWSISPALKKKNQAISKIALGTEADTDFFNPFAAFLLRQIMVLPKSLSQIKDANDFYIQTWKHLLSTKNLSFISVWSPQFLLSLMDFLKNHQSDILAITNLAKSGKNKLANLINTPKLRLSDLFPNLRLISCWTQGQSVIWRKQLDEISGKTAVQAKGLLSTEGVVSIPFGMDKHILAYTSHFYEFKATNDTILLSHQLREGEIYEVIITTAAGLYRYNTHDLVLCKGFYKSLPYLEFMGRSGNVSDMVGEKLAESMLPAFVAELQNELPQLKAFYLFPHKQDEKAQYQAVFEGISTNEMEKASTLLNAHLMENPYYQQAIAIGQLKEINGQIAPEGFSKNLSRHYQNSRNIKDGDLKLPILFPFGYWEKIKEEKLL